MYLDNFYGVRFFNSNHLILNFSLYVSIEDNSILVFRFISPSITYFAYYLLGKYIWEAPRDSIIGTYILTPLPVRTVAFG